MSLLRIFPGALRGYTYHGKKLQPRVHPQKQKTKGLKQKNKKPKLPTSQDIKDRVSALINSALSTALEQIDLTGADAD